MGKSLLPLPGQPSTNNAPAASAQLLSVKPVKTGGFRAGFKNLIHRATSPSPDKKQHSDPMPPSGQSSLSAQTSVASSTASGSTLSISTSGSISIAPTACSGLSIQTTKSTAITLPGSTGDSNTKNPVSFLQNPERTVKVPVTTVGQLFETTIQLVFYAHLLTVLDQQPTALSTIPLNQQVANTLHLTAKDCEWMEKVKDDSMEQARIRRLVVGLVNEFLRLQFRDAQSIHEIVLLGPVLNKDSYRALLRCFLAEFDKGDIMDLVMLQGLVQIIEDAPSGYLEVDNLIKILEVVRVRLETTAQQSKKLVLHLTQAVSRVLSVMADQKIKDLDRVKEHSPVGAALSGLKVDDHPYLKYQSVYVRQALKEVPDDETRGECFFRHFTNVTSSLIKVSRVMQMDLDGFANGVVDAGQNLKDIYDLLKDGWDSIKALKADGKSAISDLSSTRPWFTSLRAAEDFIRKGQLVELSTYINTAPGQADENFQWGICKLLAEMAIDSSWDMVTRGCSIDHLEQIYSTTLHPNIKRWTLTLLEHISELTTTDGSIKSQTAAIIQNLKTDNIQPFDFPCLLGRQLPFPTTFTLLKIVNNTPDLEPRLHLIQARLKQNPLSVYVPLMCKPNLQASSTENLDSLEKKVDSFLGSKREVLLILGDSGAGKSTFNRHLEHKLWSEYQPGGSIPLFIDLKAAGRLNEVDMVEWKLKREEFTDLEINQLKRSRHVILICDGYDECRQWINLHSRLKGDLGWQSFKIIITCRTQYLASTSDRIDFEPQDYNDILLSTTGLFEEVVIVPFSDDQVQVCIEQFRESPLALKVFDGQPIWSTEEYLRQLAKLMDLVKNPFMLQIALRTLPGMAKDDVDMSKTQLTKFELYDKFTRQHFDNEKKRLSKEVLGMDWTHRNAFDLLKVNFPLHCMGFSKQLAFVLFMENEGVNAIEYSTSGEEQGWKDKFFGLDVEERIKLLRQSSQLISYTIDGSSESDSSDATRIMHQFPHRSILEFMYACQLCDHGNSALFSKLFETTPYHTLSTCLAPTTSQPLLQMHPLNQRSIVSEPSVVSFLVEFVKKYPVFKEQLNTIVHLSASDGKVSQAAANAITVLVRAGIRFNNQDLAGIRIRGANLTGGQFDNTQLQGADLRDCNLRNTWLRQADLRNAKMENVIFGEWPYIREEYGVKCCAYSPNGGMLVCGLQEGHIKIYATSTWVGLYAIEAHSEIVSTVEFSRDGLHIASGSWDNTVRLWDAQTGALELVLEGHENKVNCVAYSPKCKQIASASRDKTVRIWDTHTGEVCMILNGHSSSVYSVAYSPNGQQIASGDSDGIMRIWNAQDGSICHILEGHTGTVASVVYSPNGEQIASGSWDKTVQLWNALTGKVERILTGHNKVVSSVAYSPTGQQIVSGSWDETVRLWDAKTGAAGPIMRGHGSDVNSVAYSPDGKKIVSGSYDKTVRLWDTQITSADSVLLGHTELVTSLVFSPSGHQIASSSDDHTVQLRDITTGALRMILKGHTNVLSSTAYSPSGLQIVSGSYDGTVQLWDATTGDPGLILNGHSIGMLKVTYSPNGQQIASASDDRTVRLWDAQTGGLIQISERSIWAVYGILYSPTGQQIASWSRSEVELWNTETGQSSHVLEDGLHFIEDVLYSPGGEHVVVLDEGNVWLWNAQTGVRVLPDPLDYEAASMTYSPCGKHIAIGKGNGEVGLWDTRTGAKTEILSGHTQRVTSVAYSPSGGLIASGSHDHSLRLWDVHSGVCLATVGFAALVAHVVWSARMDGTFISVGSHDHAVSVCEVVGIERQTKVHLLWTTSETKLHASTARVQNVRGLTRVNKQLLSQRGAEVIDEVDLTEV